jgi:hypothetical protein
MDAPQAAVDHTAHTAYSDPGAHAGLLDALPTDPAALSAVARNVIVHYRASVEQLPDDTRDDICLRWVEDILATDQSRHPGPLDRPRDPASRVQGCCRDHTLLCVAALRQHGVPARSRVGFAGYFTEAWHHDHVVVEAWLGGRWRRFDPEVADPLPALPDPTDLAFGDARGFLTAAQAWTGYREGRLDAETFGVAPEVPLLRGARFLLEEVIYEVAHRFGDELLLWDGWGRIAPPGAALSEAAQVWMDDVAALLLAADAGDADAEQRLLARYRADDGLRPGDAVMQASPYGGEPVLVTLARAR